MLTVVGNLKGGTGKSTVAFNLAVWLAHDKAGVKAFDLDPQCTLVDVNEVRTEDGYEPNFDVSTDLAELEVLAKDKKRKQPIIVDMSATNMFAMEKAISLADRILIPIQPSQADIWSTQRFLKIVNNNINRVTEFNFDSNESVLRGHIVIELNNIEISSNQNFISPIYV